MESISKLAYERWLSTGASSEDNWNWAVGRAAYRDTVVQYLSIDGQVLRGAQSYQVVEVNPELEVFVVHLNDGPDSRVVTSFSEAFDFVPLSWLRTPFIDDGIFTGHRLVRGPDAPDVEYRFNGRMAYTLGRTTSYDPLLQHPDGLFKLGTQPVGPEHPEGYLGGGLWPTLASADRFRMDHLSALCEDWDPEDFSVYEVALTNGWSRDVSKLGPDGIHRLLVTSRVTRKVESSIAF